MSEIVNLPWPFPKNASEARIHLQEMVINPNELLVWDPQVFKTLYLGLWLCEGLLNMRFADFVTERRSKLRNVVIYHMRTVLQISFRYQPPISPALCFPDENDEHLELDLELIKQMVILSGDFIRNSSDFGTYSYGRALTVGIGSGFEEMYKFL